MLEAQRDMAEGQYDVARSFGSLLGSFGTFGLEPRRVGGPTRHGALPTRRDGRNTTLHCLFLGRLTQKATSELGQRWRALCLFAFLFA